MTLMERIWARVEIKGPDDCWPWRDGTGYGQVRVAGKTVYVHRLIEEEAGGPLAPGEVVRHTCDWPPCCNRAHYRRGTQAANMQECRDRGRLNTRPSRGVANGNAKLTDELVVVMSIEALSMSQRSVGSMHGVARSLVHRVIRRITWRHVPAVV